MELGEALERIQAIGNLVARTEGAGVLVNLDIPGFAQHFQVPIQVAVGQVAQVFQVGEGKPYQTELEQAVAAAAKATQGEAHSLRQSVSAGA